MNELIRRAQNGDEAAMTKIINDNVGLVWMKSGVERVRLTG